jgi:hypothetical protein
MCVSWCIQGVSRVNSCVYHGVSRVYLWEGVKRMVIGRQPSAVLQIDVWGRYTGYTPDTLNAPKKHLRYTTGYPLDTPHMHPRYIPDTPGPGS